MNADEARKVARELFTNLICVCYDHQQRKFSERQFDIAQDIEAITAALLAAAAQQREADARIADNLAKWADAKKPRDDVADAEHVICTRIAAAIRGAKP